MRRLLYGVTVALALVLAGVGYSTRYTPDELSVLTYVWFAFPYLWLLVLVLCFVLILCRRVLRSIFCIVVLSLTVPKMLSVFSPIQTSVRKEVSSGRRLKVLTYNVCSFSMADLKENRNAALDTLASYFEREGADVICIQEGLTKKWLDKTLDGSERLRKVLDRYPHRVLSNTGRAGEHYVFSKYSVRKVSAADALGASDEGAKMRGVQVVDVSVPWGGSVRLFNCHLTSIGLSQNQISSVSEGGLNSQRAETLKSTLEKMMEAFRLREVDVRLLCKAISNTRGSVLVCGDFNDTPISYTYESVMDVRTADGLSLEDAFVGSGFGLGDTYRGNLPPIRIDYVFASEDLRLTSYVEHDCPTSDHCYVTAFVTTKE